MPITIHLDAMLVKRKISLTELSKAVGLSLTNLSMLKNGNIRGVRFETLEKICIVLNCQPGDLIKYESYTDEKIDKNRKDIFETINKNLTKLKIKEK
jgi:putative transcriptional regulator|tara:strand:+ start:1582 stop:1872 length:291 start_codon:yes stop_codon:yes gene_type:complete